MLCYKALLSLYRCGVSSCNAVLVTEGNLYVSLVAPVFLISSLCAILSACCPHVEIWCVCCTATVHPLRGLRSAAVPSCRVASQSHHVSERSLGFSALRAEPESLSRCTNRGQLVLASSQSFNSCYAFKLIGQFAQM
eukprot:1427480-Amphidinium_carterae.1